MEPSFITPAVPARPRSLGSLMGDSLRRPGGRRALSVLSVVLFLAGVAMFAYPVATDVYSKYRQGNLNSQFGSKQLADEYRSGKVPIGSALTRLVINTKAVKVDVLVVEGTTPAALRAGAGHYPGTPLPGEAGNVGIAGHRTTFGRPFNHIDELNVGDEVVLETPFNKFHYKVVPGWGTDGHAYKIVDPSDYTVVQPVAGKSLLTLTSCHPKGSAKKRITVRLELQPKETEVIKQKGAKS
ncbi:MAG: Membrane protein [Frankiales bacterium]|nr:Membrane protein [Frankiales bacterium]